MDHDVVRQDGGREVTIVAESLLKGLQFLAVRNIERIHDGGDVILLRRQPIMGNQLITSKTCYERLL